MKKTKYLWVCAALLFSLLLWPTASAATASAALSGPAGVRAGDAISVAFVLNGTKIEGVSGTLQYDSSQLTLNGTTQNVASPWMVEFNGNNFMAYDNAMSSPLTGNVTLFTASFTVNSGVAAGTTIKVTAGELVATDMTDIPVASATYSTTVLAPVSSNCKLGSLTVANATLSPAFSADVVSYSAGTVPNSTTNLQVSAKAADAGATVKVGSTALAVGSNTVKITVTAENGATKTYSITVTRQAAAAVSQTTSKSSVSTLSGITVSGFSLSPAFNAKTTSYTVQVPYETASVSVKATATHAKASVKVSGGTSLKAGADNTVTIVCTAENGAQTTYTLMVKRAAASAAVSSSESAVSSVSSAAASSESASSALESSSAASSRPVSSDAASGAVSSTPSASEAVTSEPEKVHIVWSELLTGSVSSPFFWIAGCGVLVLFLLLGMLLGYAICSRRFAHSQNGAMRPDAPEQAAPTPADEPANISPAEPVEPEKEEFADTSDLTSDLENSELNDLVEDDFWEESEANKKDDKTGK